MKQRPKLPRFLAAMVGAMGALMPMAERNPTFQPPTQTQQQRQQGVGQVTETPTANIATRVFGSGHRRYMPASTFIWVGRDLRGRSGSGKKRRHDPRR